MDSQQDSNLLNPTTITDSSILDMDSKETIVNEVVRMITTSKGHRNLGRRKVPTVPIDHWGPVPDVPVGTCWQYRWQVSEAGVHRPTVAGIHGRENKGAYSIVLSGVYEDDKDYGEHFYYSGCGGKEKDKKKRLSPQVYDQQLTRHNRGLALCCNAPVDDEKGADAGDRWHDGKPVRVVRKHSKFSEYAPKEGFRYDGIYKVVKYYPVMNKRTGLRVWTYELRRHDETPAPWTTDGKLRIEELNLRMIVPENEPMEDNYVCSQIGSKILLKKRAVIPSRKLRRQKKSTTTTTTTTTTATTINRSRYDFRLRIPTEETEDVDIKPDIEKLKFSSGAYIPWSSSDQIPILHESEENDMDIDICEDVKPDLRELNLRLGIEHLPVIQSTSSLAPNEGVSHSSLLAVSPRKSERSWEIPLKLVQRISEDILNKPTWEYLQNIEFRSEQDFMNHVRIIFLCPVCSNVVRDPITPPCLHNICLNCLNYNFEKQINWCPICRIEFPEIVRRFGTNIYLTNILNTLFSSTNELPS